jgi:hypothetical protein
MIKKIFVFIVFLSLIDDTNAQQDAYNQLKTQYDRLRGEEKNDSALVVAKQMSTWALNRYEFEVCGEFAVCGELF